ncbi:lytic transglycosylase domain-containing protein [Marinifilum caeruleilacunae]|uniref:LysM peptidoglycan-binding domain-containing protein n=1 Tax=Marinifilum caeruleilacunae TaxID=2499076 RepID=A0ABX1WRQ8_9BACT|nr:lytic transglycosylase domain-containing protein [Marinifilum caeruleilacunae]NOU58758.1 LysM peptidoglycan-binding domain-containing protein [Marinifilum caeruleilacunae]
MRRKIFFIPLILLGTSFACSTIQPNTTQNIQEERVVTENVLSEIDTVKTEIVATETAQETDTLAFLKLNNVDVRYDLDDKINPNFSSNLDSLLHLWYLNHNESQYSNETVNTNVPLNDSVYINRLKEIPSLIDLSYNKIVKNYIKLYSEKRRSQVEYMMGLSEYYFPLFEEILDKEGLPQELKYLPIIESALNPKALSRAGASGLWQFMYGTGRMYKLDINSFVDERRDPVKSSYAAVKYLKDMYKVYGNWHLVIAAYNCGPGNVNKAIRRSGGKRNYWDIYYRLPRETRGYVPAFIAAIYTFNYHKEHNLYPKKSNFPIACDTLMIDETLHFDQVSNVIHIPKEQLRDLNPQYRADILPGGKAYSLKLPLELTSKFIDMQDSIFAYKKDYYFSQKDKVVNPRDRYQKFAHVTPKNKAKVYYKVKPGDAVGLIASWFHVRTSDLRYWNNIRRNLIKVGQKLVVYVPKSKADYYKGFNTMSYAQKQATLGKSVSTSKTVSKSTPAPTNDGSYVYYTVRRGDNFWTIAKKFPGVSNYDIMKLNNIKDARSLKVGQKLRIKRKS